MNPYKTPRSLFTQKLTEVSVFYAFWSILEDSSGVLTVICDRGVKTQQKGYCLAMFSRISVSAWMFFIL